MFRADSSSLIRSYSYGCTYLNSLLSLLVMDPLSPQRPSPARTHSIHSARLHALDPLSSSNAQVTHPSPFPPSLPPTRARRHQIGYSQDCSASQGLHQRGPVLRASSRPLDYNEQCKMDSRGDDNETATTPRYQRQHTGFINDACSCNLRRTIQNRVRAAVTREHYVLYGKIDYSQGFGFYAPPNDTFSLLLVFGAKVDEC